jgi:hypothetical protein
MIARIIARIAVPCLALLALAPLAWAEEAPNLTMENEFVRVVVNRGPNETGRFSIRTTGGDPSRPSSKNQHLIFGGNSPWTSYTTVRIDGADYAFGGPTVRRSGLKIPAGKVIAGPEIKDDKLVTTCAINDIEVTQELAFVRGLSTRMLDTVGITYRITNKGTAAHNVGLRVTLDTMCGTNDGAPIRMGGMEITKAVDVPGDKLVDNWQAFDSLRNPTVISQGTLRGGATTAPDKVIFADWGTLADVAWDVQLTPDQGFIRTGEVDADTAAAMYWNPTTVDAGQTKSYTTYYGIGDMSLAPGKFDLGLNAPAETIFEHERTQAFTITALVQNSGGFEARNAVVTLTLPDGLELLGGNDLKTTYPSVKPDAMIQESWTVRPTGKAGGKGVLMLMVASDNIESNKVYRAIQLNVPAMKLNVLPAKQQVPLTTNKRATIIPIQLNLMPAEKVYGARVTLSFDPNVIRPFDTSRGRAFVDEGKLLPGWDVDDSDVDNGHLTLTGLRTGAPLITQAEVNLAIVKFRTVAAGKSAITLEKAVLLNEKGEEKTLDVAAGEVVVTPDAK